MIAAATPRCLLFSPRHDDYAYADAGCLFSLSVSLLMMATPCCRLILSLDACFADDATCLMLSPPRFDDAAALLLFRHDAAGDIALLPLPMPS